jgi:hypothetical protein
MIDWTFAPLLRSDVVKVSLDGESMLGLPEAALGVAAAGPPEEGVLTESATGHSALAHPAVLGDGRRRHPALSWRGPRFELTRCSA